MQIASYDDDDFNNVDVDDDDFDGNDAIFRQRATLPISTGGACNSHFSYQ